MSATQSRFGAANRLADQAAEIINRRQPGAITAVVASTAGGVITAQSIADRVMTALDMPLNPSTPGQFAVSIVTKLIVAGVFGAVAVNLGGLGMLAFAIAGVGALTSAGVDVLFALFETAPADLLPFSPEAAAAPANAHQAHQAQDRSPSTAQNGNSGGSSSPDITV